MTVRLPLFLQAGSHPAEDVRLMLDALLGGSSNNGPNVGIVASGDYAVTASGTPDNFVHVAPGAAFVAGTESTTQGVYTVVSDTSASVPIAAPDATNDRISLIVLQVLDAFYSGSDSFGQIVEVAGAPAPAPVAPATPDNAIALAQVRVVAGSGAAVVTGANITDARHFQAPSSRSLIVADAVQASPLSITGATTAPYHDVLTMSVPVQSGQKYRVDAWAVGAFGSATSGPWVGMQVVCSDSALAPYRIAAGSLIAAPGTNPTEYVGSGSRVYTASADGTVTFTLQAAVSSGVLTFGVGAAEMSAAIG